VTEKVIAYCREENLPSETALQLGVAVEELILNIEDHGYKDKKSKYIDVCLSKNGDRYYLRLRDDGIPFDPTSYASKEEHDEDEITGLELIRKLALKITYMRVLNLNNTIIEIDKGAIGGNAND
ncbi:MAG: ATP-binding protein, partial [Lachnospiraceae bacterium]|nr:ATP-binding protein [Lachnospiraceae bacterium]